MRGSVWKNSDRREDEIIGRNFGYLLFGMEVPPEEQVIMHRSRWFHGALAIAILNPIFAGLILGVLMWRSPNMRREGRIITVFSLAWGLITLLLALKYGVIASQK